MQNNSRHISTTGMHKPRVNLFCTVTPNTCGSSVWNKLLGNVPVERIFMWYLHFGKIFWYLIYTVWNRTKVNDVIIIWLCLLNDISFFIRKNATLFFCFLYVLLRITFISTTSFVWYYRSKSVRFETIWMEKCTEFYASIL